MADVVGLDTFVSHFEGHEESYVLIGGAACSLWLGAQGLPFRRTRDLDIVIVIEGTNDEFFQLLWQFIEDGNYRSRERGTAKPQFYRFYDPASADYPYMLDIN